MPYQYDPKKYKKYQHKDNPQHLEHESNRKNTYQEKNIYRLKSPRNYNAQNTQSNSYRYPYAHDLKVRKPSEKSSHKDSPLKNSLNVARMKIMNSIEEAPEHNFNTQTRVHKFGIEALQPFGVKNQKVTSSDHPLRSARYHSQPSIVEKNTKRASALKKVNFRNNNLATNLSPALKKQRRTIESSLSPPILKKSKSKKPTRTGSVPYIYNPPNVRNKSQQSVRSVASVELSEQISLKEQKLNSIVKNKYKSILINLQSRMKYDRVNNKPMESDHIKGQRVVQEQIQIKQENKYVDNLFPPTLSSIFGIISPKTKDKISSLSIKWLRIHEVFPNKKTIVYGSGKSHISIIHENFITKNASQELASALNSIKNCRNLQRKMFQEQQQINKFGLYMVKIFQENMWKYILIDDKIPVIEKSNVKSKTNTKMLTSLNPGSKYVPLFLNLVQHENLQIIEVWPLLLQKAYASYYSSYEGFHQGNTVDYLEELTGCPFFQTQFKDKQIKNQVNQVKEDFQKEEFIGIGQVEEHFAKIPLLSLPNHHKTMSKTKTVPKDVIYCDPVKNFNEISTVFEKLPTILNKIYTSHFQKYQYRVSSQIGVYQKSSNLPNSKSNRSEISVREFTINNGSDIQISIRQRQKRFYHNSTFNYEYMWIRVILIEKQLNGFYRWVTGKYSNSKSINLRSFLSQGQYILVVMPQWRQTHCHEINIFLHSNQQISLQKGQYKDQQRIIEKACMDLAQRKGKINQINSFICSYNYVNEDVGLIIENINNQRDIGLIKVMRSINGLHANVEIVPLNREFYEIKPHEENKKKFKTNITISIPQNESYTVVLRMKGGIDHQFFKVFDFGN